MEYTMYARYKDKIARVADYEFYTPLDDAPALPYWDEDKDIYICLDVKGLETNIGYDELMKTTPDVTKTSQKLIRRLYGNKAKRRKKKS